MAKLPFGRSWEEDRPSPRFVDLPEPPSPMPWRSEPVTREAGETKANRLSFARGRAPPLPDGVRTRNLDVGARIGRRPAANHKGRPASEGSEGQKLSAMELQMLRIESRQKADVELSAAQTALEQAIWERGLDSIPYLPGRWTEKLHANVIRCIQDCKESVRRAEVLYASAEAKANISQKSPDY